MVWEKICVFFLRRRNFLKNSQFVFVQICEEGDLGIINWGISQIWLQVTDEMKVEKIRIKKGLRRALTFF